VTWGIINNILLQRVRKTYFVLLFALINFSLINAQESSTLFFMYTLPQSNLTNPAVQIPCKVFVGMPLLSSIHFNYSNSFFSYSDLISGTGKSLKINYDFLASKPNSTQDISTELHISLINFGFLLGDYYFNFNVSDKFNGGLFYSTNLFDFAKRLPILL